jgi:AcrR family transcriptional regulator
MGYGMGRPRKFDLDEAIRVASDLFWQKGYDETSVQDLTRAMGITAPSFYFAFGSKEALFLQVLDAYRARRSAAVGDVFAQPTIRGVLERLFGVVAAFLTDPAHPPGCLMINNALPMDDAHPFRVSMATQRDALRQQLRLRLEQALAAGEKLPPGVDPDGMSRLLVAMMWGMAVEAQSGADCAALLKARDAFLSLWPDPADESAPR